MKFMARTLILAVILLTAAITLPEAAAQTATLNGFVTDATSGQPLELVNVVLEQNGEIQRGAATDADGLFLIPRITPGEYVLRITFIGYTPYVDTLSLAAGDVRTASVALEPAAIEQDEVVVETERTAGMARVTAGQQTIRPADVELIPSPDISGDLVSYLTTMPGVVSTGDRGGQLFIRGGEPSQNLVMLDNMVLYQPFHVLGFYSMFPADILQRSDVYAGGYGARYGGAISSVIDVSARPGNSQAFAGAASISPFVSSARLEGPIVPGRLSFIASARKSVLDEGAERYVDEPLPFDFSDVFAKLHWISSRKSRVSASFLSGFDRGIIGEDTGGEAPEQVHWRTQAGGLRYLIVPRVLPVAAEFHLSISKLRTELGPADAPVRWSSIQNAHALIDGTFYGEDVDFHTGMELNFISLESELGGQFQNVELRAVGVDHLGLYVEPEIELGAGLRLRVGSRLQFYSRRIDPYVEPRMRIVWEVGRHQLSAAAGVYHQEIIGLSDRRDASSVFTVYSNIPDFLIQAEGIGESALPRAIHAIAGYRLTPFVWLDFAVEGFYKDLANLFISEWTSFPRFSSRLQPASGRSLGADVRVEAQAGPFLGYVNYGISSTRYTARQAALELWYGTETLSFRPPHDRRHQINALASVEVAGFDLSLRWEFGSGLPFSRALGFDGFMLVDDIIDVFEAPNRRRVIYERPYNAVLPTFHRLDVSLDRTFELGFADVTLQGSVINLYDRDNIFYYDIFTLRRVDQLPRLPSLALQVEFN